MPLSCLALLGTVLCLGQVIRAQTGHLHRPFISAEPGPVVHRGSSVTFVCRGPSSVDTFHLEKEGGPFNETMYEKESHFPETEARFPIASASEHHAGRYRCIYYKRSMWSEHSKFLELKVTDEGATQGPPTSQALPSAPSPRDCTVLNCVRLGLAGALLLTLGAILAEAWRSGRGAHPGPKAGRQLAPTRGL